jgi:hypothetical protein
LNKYSIRCKKSWEEFERTWNITFVHMPKFWLSSFLHCLCF